MGGRGDYSRSRHRLAYPTVSRRGDLVDRSWAGPVARVRTLARVVVLIVIASLIWVPIGVWVGTRPRVVQVVQPAAQFMAAFPANLLFPISSPPL